MNDGRSKRRRYKRVYFSKQNSVVGVLKLSDDHERAFTADVKDLSEGGVGFAIKRDHNHKIIPGNRLTIEEIQGSEQLGFMHNIEIKVTWVRDFNALEHVGFGCEFLDMPRASKDKIRNCVRAWTELNTCT